MAASHGLCSSATLGGSSSGEVTGPLDRRCGHPRCARVTGYASAADDGTFWMSFDDLLDYFRFIEACRVRPHWAEVRVRGSLPVLGGGMGGDGGGSGRLPAGANGAGLGAFSIEVLDTCEVEVSLIQRNGRGDSTHEFTDLLVLAMQKDSGPSAVGGWRVVAASRRELRMSVTLEATLSAGHYMILPLSLRPRTGRHAAPLPYVLRIGSAKPLICEATAATATDVQAGLAGYIDPTASGTPPLTACARTLCTMRRDGSPMPKTRAR